MILQTKEIIAWMYTENLRKFVAKCVSSVFKTISCFKESEFIDKMAQSDF